MAPKHDKANGFLRSNLFDGLDSFATLEQRIADLPTRKERGDAFEVFVEAYLCTQAIRRSAEVWPQATAPIHVLRELNLRTQDHGADGVYCTLDGDYVAYQAKFRATRKPISFRELATFFGSTDNVSQRVLFANSDRISGIAEERSRFHWSRGADFDRLEQDDFKRIFTWLKTGQVKLKPRTPDRHQREALKAIRKRLTDNDRAKVIMACGTGKTLVSLWAAEQSEPRSVIVLLPSLALVRQTLHEWARWTSWGDRFRYLCVCSDPTVARGVDKIVVHQADADFQIARDSDDVRRFLAKRGDAVRVVFSTYHSAHVVAGGMTSRKSFDLGIFDEAHKTAGREGARDSFALSDKNLRIKKRLFFTATPRHYDIRKKDKEGDAKVVFSMDVLEDYGPVIHKLSFAEAARRDIICDYKVAVSIVTSDMVNNELLSRGEVLVEGDPIKARHVANQIALQKAVEKYDLCRIITFHRGVPSAKSFVAADAAGINVHLPDFEAYHVNGTQRTADREGFIKAFAEAGYGLVSNARCLTEGVDIPAVDMVAFMSPKRSKVDIAQATGRAMRKDRDNPNKTHGYVLVPLFVEQEAGETVEEAVVRTEFEEVWNVLQAMQEQDDVLADVIRQMREDRGRTGGYDDSRFRERVVFLGPSLSLQTLRDAITAECVDRLGVTWDERFGELVRYKEAHGDCNVPQRWPENPQLAKWAPRQRTAQKKGTLSEDRIRRLVELDFVWDAIDAFWEEMFAALVAYKDFYEDCNVPRAWSGNPKLPTWVSNQRVAQKNGTLSEDHIRRLVELDFAWDAIDTVWEEMFAALVAYKDVYGDCNVPRAWPENPKFSLWVNRQRHAKRNETLSEDHIRRLVELDFVWNPRDAYFEKMFAALVEYKEAHGDCNVPARWSENPKLGQWVTTTRQARKKGALSEERIRRLDEIGFRWYLRTGTASRTVEI